MTLVEVWVGYALIGVLICSVMLIWAVRTGQFSDMERASRIVQNEIEPIEGLQIRSSRADRLTVIAIALITSAMLGYTLWVALR